MVDHITLYPKLCQPERHCEYSSVISTFNSFQYCNFSAIYQCFAHSWYLSVDMQLFFISPLVMYLIYRFETKAIFGMVLMIVGCIGCTVAVHLKYGFKSFLYVHFSRHYINLELMNQWYFCDIVFQVKWKPLTDRRISGTHLG